MMNKTILEYVWLDGYSPEPNLRSKIKVVDRIELIDSRWNLADIPEWSFDGSSTQQADGNSSDCLLIPVNYIPDPRTNDDNRYIVLCEVGNSDGTPHKTNTRNALEDDLDLWFGFEQEYVLTDENGRPLGFPPKGFPNPQGEYYCGVGNRNISGREVSLEHLDLCIKAGLNITGTNAEVMLGQWEYQVLGKGQQSAGDDLWLSRFLLLSVAEKHGVDVDFHPKPISGDWNGSGMHVNFSDKTIRESGDERYIKSVIAELETSHQRAIKLYGSDNDKRLTGKHETQHIDTFSWGVSDRGASIRVPLGTVNNGWKGYLEDRRPAANADPYKITGYLADIMHSSEHKNKSNNQ